MMPSTKHLLSSIAIIATLAIAAPVWAQTVAPMTPSSRAPAAAAPAAPIATTATHKRMYVHHQVSHHRGHHYAHHRTRPGDIANQLNVQELARVGSSSAPSMAGSAGWGYGQQPPTQGGAPAGLMAPGTLGGGYGQPSPTQGMPGGNQPSASSHP